MGCADSDLISNDLTKVLLDSSVDSYQTFLNPDNMRGFYISYSEGDYETITQRFDFNSNS